MSFMKEFEQQKGIAFLLLFFRSRDEIYYLPYRDAEHFWEPGGRGWPQKLYL